MFRRRLLAATATVGLAGFGGCLGARAPRSDRPARRAYPPRPDPLDADTVGPYAAEYEEVHRHNAILDETRGTDEADVREIVVGAGVESVTRRDGGFEVVVSVGFYYTFGRTRRVVRPASPTGDRTVRPTASPGTRPSA